MGSATGVFAEQRNVVQASWETYERLLAEREQHPRVLFYYDSGLLEIMTVYQEHEWVKRRLELIVDLVSFEAGINAESIGHTTLKRRDLKKGAEPDSGFYIRNYDHFQVQRELDLAKDPPPDLIIEVDITRDSMPKEALYAGIGILEWWKTDGRTVTILVLREGRYVVSGVSGALPVLTGEGLQHLLFKASELGPNEWKRYVREYVRSALL